MTDGDSTLIRILLVEDNPADIELVREAFEESTIANAIEVIEDGAEAVEYLMARKGDRAALPDIVLLDINLPHISGLDILRQIKETEGLKLVPVIMLTSSEDDKDILSSYENYCSGFITKPVDVDEFVDLVSRIEGFWFALVKSPMRRAIERSVQ